MILIIFDSIKNTLRESVESGLSDACITACCSQYRRESSTTVVLRVSV